MQIRPTTLTAPQVAAMLGVTVRTLQKLEKRPDGPRRMQIPGLKRAVRYDPDTIAAWMRNLPPAAQRRAA